MPVVISSTRRNGFFSRCWCRVVRGRSFLLLLVAVIFFVCFELASRHGDRRYPFGEVTKMSNHDYSNDKDDRCVVDMEEDSDRACASAPSGGDQHQIAKRIPFFGSQDADSTRQIASHLDHRIEEYKQDLVNVVQVCRSSPLPWPLWVVLYNVPCIQREPSLF